MPSRPKTNNFHWCSPPPPSFPLIGFHILANLKPPLFRWRNRPSQLFYITTTLFFLSVSLIIKSTLHCQRLLSISLCVCVCVCKLSAESSVDRKGYPTHLCSLKKKKWKGQSPHCPILLADSYYYDETEWTMYRGWWFSMNGLFFFVVVLFAPFKRLYV